MHLPGIATPCRRLWSFAFLFPPADLSEHILEFTAKSSLSLSRLIQTETQKRCIRTWVCIPDTTARNISHHTYRLLGSLSLEPRLFVGDDAVATNLASTCMDVILEAQGVELSQTRVSVYWAKVAMLKERLRPKTSHYADTASCLWIQCC